MVMWCSCGLLQAQEPATDSAQPESPTEEQAAEQAVQNEIGTNEDPDANRRTQQVADQETSADISSREPSFKWNFYDSLRLHAIDNLDLQRNSTGVTLADGASRAGITADWQMRNGWKLFGRVEAGFDILKTFTPKGRNDGGGALHPRLYNITLETPSVYLKVGKSWSSYYTVAGISDRFAIFGGSAAGVYNAGTDGGDTGTGRANNAVQTRIYLHKGIWTRKHPLNLNVQYQQGQDIPATDGLKYGSAWGFSTWVETERSLGLGFAWQHASVDYPANNPALRAAGLDGDANAYAVGFKGYGDRWLASLVFARLYNVVTTDELKYIDANGSELFVQWQAKGKWWIVGGYNWQRPLKDEQDAGRFKLGYAVLGFRYTIESFERMIYAEYRIENSVLANGDPVPNIFTVGFRWGFG